jgi:hypothetical protein
MVHHGSSGSEGWLAKLPDPFGQSGDSHGQRLANWTLLDFMAIAAAARSSLVQSPMPRWSTEGLWRFGVTATLVGGCSVQGAGPGDALPSGPKVDRVDPADGVPARGYEPAVVSLAVGGVVTCAGALVASDVVVTARHCVTAITGPVECPDAGRVGGSVLPPGAIVVRSGDDEAAAVECARGRAVLVPPGDDICDADIALVLLDAAVEGVAPFVPRATGPAAADHLRTVSWVGGELLLRDHVLVVGTSPAAMTLREPVPLFAAGGPALDETTGALVGIASRPDAPSSGSTTVYARTDAFAPLFDEAMAESAYGSPSTTAHLLKAHVGPADMGATCTRGADCAAGACVAVDAARYCSRTCGPRDRCPSTFRCEIAAGGGAVCIKT